MKLLPRGRAARGPRVGVVVPAYQVAGFLGECLDSVLGQTHRNLDVVVVDDGSTDGTGELAERYAARDPRLRVVHTPNRGLGAARNEGARRVTGDYLAFADSDDVLPADAYAVQVAQLASSGSDFVAASLARWERGGLAEPPWMHRLHRERRTGIGADDHPEILGDVFAVNKLFRRASWDSAGLSWPEGTRYEDQPTATAAFLRGRFDVVPDVVYHWRIRGDGTSITQQRASLADLVDRMETKRVSLATVRAEASPHVQAMFLDRVLPGDLWRYFEVLPAASDEWWTLLHAAVRELWGERSLVHSGLRPVHRLTGWLVEQGRRGDAVAVMEYAAAHQVARVTDSGGVRRLDLPPGVLDLSTVDPRATLLRPHER